MINELTMLAVSGVVVLLLLVLRGLIFRRSTSHGYRVWIINFGDDGDGDQADDNGEWPAEIAVPENFFNRNKSFAQEVQSTVTEI